MSLLNLQFVFSKSIALPNLGNHGTKNIYIFLKRKSLFSFLQNRGLGLAFMVGGIIADD